MIIKENLSLEDFIKMSKLEEEFYDKSHITPAEEAYDWYLKYPYSTKVLTDNGAIIGFVDMFLIKENIFELLKSGKFNDKNLTSDGIVDIEKAPAKEYNMFLCCLVVAEEYRKTNALEILLKAHIDFYSQLREKGIIIKNIITDNVTEKGEKFSKRLGFAKQTETIYDSVIYMMDYKLFEKNVIDSFASK